MIIEKIKTVEEKSSIELKLPAYFREDDNKFFRINEDESYVRAMVGINIGSIQFYNSNSWDYNKDISKIAGKEEITEQEFFDAYYSVLNTTTKHLQAKPITELVEA